jgi:hypothetical protein
VDCQFDPFDKVVAPILLYGSEIWGFENFDIVECIHVKFLKRIQFKKLHASIHGLWRNRALPSIYFNIL